MKKEVILKMNKYNQYILLFNDDIVYILYSK